MKPKYTKTFIPFLIKQTNIFNLQIVHPIQGTRAIQGRVLPRDIVSVEGENKSVITTSRIDIG